MNMKSIVARFFPLAVLLLGLLVFGCQPKKPDPVPMGTPNTYTDQAYGFSVQYPQTWQQLGAVGKAVFAKSQEVIEKFQDVSSGEPGGMVTVSVVELQGKQPSDLIQSEIEELKQGYQVDPIDSVQVAGKMATKVSYSVQVTTKHRVYGYSLFVPGDTALYKMEFLGYGDYYEAHKAVYDAMQASFTLPKVVAKKSDVWAPSANLSDYKSDFFTFQYPENLNFVQVPKGSFGFVMEMRPADRNDCSFHVDVFGAQKLTVEKVWDQNKGKYKARNTGTSPVDGNTAYWVDYTPRKDASARAYFLVKNNNVIRVTLNWYEPLKDAYFPAFEKMVNSMKLK
jgi:hypothetical protein